MTWPVPFIEEVETYALTLEGVEHSIRRPVSSEDGHRTITFGAAEWHPVGSAEMGGTMGPTNGRYEVQIELLVKSVDAPSGQAELVQTANQIRQMVFRDGDMHIRLGQIEPEAFGAKERFTRCGVTRTTYLSNKSKGHFLHLAILEAWIETGSC